MEVLVRQYLRILDIDSCGYFIRLTNISHNHSIDLSNIYIRQFNNNNTLTSYKFKNSIKCLLHHGDVVTIYSKSYDQIKFNIEPYIFIAENIRQWLTDETVQTEISLNKIVMDSYRFYSFTSNDIPSLFINRSIKSNELSRKVLLYSNEYARFIFPYCLPDNNIVNPHTWAIDKIKFQRSIVKDFDSYPRRLTTTLS